MKIPAMTMKSKLYALIVVLGLMPAGATGVSFLLLKASDAVQEALGGARQGTIKLEHINALVYAVVMESRGIYMSASASEAEPYIRNMTAKLEEMQSSADQWKRIAIPSERARIDDLSAKIDEFVRFRAELMRLAREASTAEARKFGDNDSNRTVRSALNKQLDDLARRYEGYAQTAEEAIESGKHTQLIVQLGLAVGAAVSLLIGLILVRSGLIRPLLALRKVMQRLAVNDLECSIPCLGRKDEIGDMARTIEVFHENAIQRRALQAKTDAMHQEEYQRNAQLEQLVRDATATHEREVKQIDEMEALIRNFRAVITGVTSSLSTETEMMRSAATALSEAATTATDKAATAAKASTGVAGNAKTVAAATEELSKSIAEISQQAQRASVVVTEAASAANGSDRDVQRLAQTVGRIGAVTDLINTIAGQTNLLALNATIEAARAGEAGRGFAVVASEVKALAMQTAKATQEIAVQVAEIQSSTTTAVDSIQRIATRVAEIEMLNGAVAAAIEEQEAVTNDISANVAASADGSSRAVKSVEGVNAAAAATACEADRVLRGSNTLSSVMMELRQSVDTFLAAVIRITKARRTADRRDENFDVFLRSSRGTVTAKAVNVSETGIAISSNHDVVIGETVTVDLGTGARRATVVWVNGNRAGLHFEQHTANAAAA